MIYENYENFLKKKKKEGLLRVIPSSQGRFKTNFSSNDYLNLSQHPKVIENANAYCEKWGAGATSVRLLLKSRQEIYNNLEKKIAQAKQTEAALLFPSAYQINATVIPALLNNRVFRTDPLVFADKLVHESILHGIQAAQVKQLRYHHLDMNHLESLLKKYNPSPQPKFIISETIFSMDGDVPDMKALVFLSQKYNAFLYLDESHATGVIGSQGYGLSQDFSQFVDISISTLSKGVGAFGGFIACSNLLRDYLINSCSGFIYSSVLPPSTIGAIDAAWDLIPSMERERHLINKYASQLRQKINELGYKIGSSSTQIIPILLGDNQTTMEALSIFAQEGISVSGVRPPTVPENSSRLRVCLNASHTQNDVDFFVNTLQKIGSFA
jgi:8-amino-7-oxononanoate synthase